jgi:hypothetical protein
MDSRSTPVRAAGARKTISSTRDQKAAQRPGQAGARMIARRLIAPPCALMAGNAGHPVAEISHRPNFKAEANLASREHARLCWSCFGGEDRTQPPRGKPRCPRLTGTRGFPSWMWRLRRFARRPPSSHFWGFRGHAPRSNRIALSISAGSQLTERSGRSRRTARPQADRRSAVFVFLLGRRAPQVVCGGQLANYVAANRFRAPTTAVMNVSPPPWPASSRT